ncbi:MAG: hypothetical protein GY830_02815 [Bacteroidetes bacterium]|nr:hypothetical protein [Bacteroidota bacterium]
MEGGSIKLNDFKIDKKDSFKIVNFDLKKIKELEYIPFFEIKDPKSNDFFYILLTKHIISSKKFKIPKIVFEKLKKSKGIIFENNPFNDTSKIHNSAIKLVYEKIENKRNEVNSILKKLMKLKNKNLTKNNTSENKQSKTVLSNKEIEKHIISSKKLLDHYDKMLNLSKQMLEVRKKMGGSREHLMISIAHLAYSLLYPNNFLFMENELLKYVMKNNLDVNSLDDDIIIQQKNKKGLISEAADMAIEIINNLAIPEIFQYHLSIENEMTDEYIKGKDKGFKKRSKMDLYKKNVIDRNLNWIDKFKNKSNHIFTIGADHFLGKYGIKNLLEKRGLIVNQVKY